MKTSQKGFSAFEAIIILSVVLLLGLGGWYVWSKSSGKDDTKDTSSKAKDSSSEKTVADPTDDWVLYSNAPGEFSFKHPAAWVQASNPENCNEGLALFGPTEATVGKCATESFGQVAVMSVAGDQQATFMFDESYYADATTENVTVGGVAGKKLSATVMGMESAVVVGGLPDNTKLVRYVFYTNGKTYVATYAQQPTYPDVLADFNLLVTKTFKFSA